MPRLVGGGGGGGGIQFGRLMSSFRHRHGVFRADPSRVSPSSVGWSSWRSSHPSVISSTITLAYPYGIGRQ